MAKSNVKARRQHTRSKCGKEHINIRILASGESETLFDVAKMPVELFFLALIPHRRHLPFRAF